MFVVIYNSAYGSGNEAYVIPVRSVHFIARDRLSLKLTDEDKSAELHITEEYICLNVPGFRKAFQDFVICEDIGDFKEYNIVHVGVE